jgi:hypothetical protein
VAKSVTKYGWRLLSDVKHGTVAKIILTVMIFSTSFFCKLDSSTDYVSVVFDKECQGGYLFTLNKMG